MQGYFNLYFFLIFKINSAIGPAQTPSFSPLRTTAPKIASSSFGFFLLRSFNKEGSNFGDNAKIALNALETETDVPSALAISVAALSAFTKEFFHPLSLRTFPIGSPEAAHTPTIAHMRTSFSQRIFFGSFPILVLIPVEFRIGRSSLDRRRLAALSREAKLICSFPLRLHTSFLPLL